MDYQKVSSKYYLQLRTLESSSGLSCLANPNFHRDCRLLLLTGGFPSLGSDEDLERNVFVLLIQDLVGEGGWDSSLEADLPASIPFSKALGVDISRNRSL